jgi:hypothetical protein
MQYYVKKNICPVFKVYKRPATNVIRLQRNPPSATHEFPEIRTTLPVKLPIVTINSTGAVSRCHCSIIGHDGIKINLSLFVRVSGVLARLG